MPDGELAQIVNGYLGSRKGAKPSSLEALLEERQAEEEAEDETRDVMIFVVGTGRAPGLERMIKYLSRNFGMPISVVSYEVFEIEGGQRVLARELADLETGPPVQPVKGRTVEEICAIADRSGLGKDFRSILEAAR